MKQATTSDKFQIRGRLTTFPTRLLHCWIHHGNEDRSIMQAKENLLDSIQFERYILLLSVLLPNAQNMFTNRIAEIRFPGILPGNAFVRAL